MSGVIVTARGVLKILRFHGLAWEDYLMIISMVSSTPNFHLNNHKAFANDRIYSSSQLSTESRPRYYMELTLPSILPFTRPNLRNISTSAMLSVSWLRYSVASHSVFTCCVFSAQHPLPENAASTPLSHSNSWLMYLCRSWCSRNAETSTIFGATAWRSQRHLACTT